MKRLLITIALAAITMTATPTVLAKSKYKNIVNCEIKARGETLMKDKCEFVPLRGGNFMIANASTSNQPLYSGNGGDVHFIEIQLPGKGNKMLTSWDDGSEMIDHGVRRSNKNKGCWISSSYEVCAWK